MPRRKRITIECPHCSATYEGTSDIEPPAFCSYCGREVEEWIVEGEENPEATAIYFDDGTIEFDY